MNALELVGRSMGIILDKSIRIFTYLKTGKIIRCCFYYRGGDYPGYKARRGELLWGYLEAKRSLQEEYE